jgi:hypothetical protein
MSEPTPLQQLLSQLNEVSMKQPLTLQEWELKNKISAQYGADVHSEVEDIMNDMTEPTPLQRLIFHLDEASTAALELRRNTELPMDMMELYHELDDYVTDLMEYETNLPTNND